MLNEKAIEEMKFYPTCYHVLVIEHQKEDTYLFSWLDTLEAGLIFCLSTKKILSDNLWIVSSIIS
jgi:hypothetical protein